MTSVERVFVDTNILLAATDRGRAEHLAAQRILELWPAEGVTLFTSGQVIREYLAVATRPLRSNGLGLTVAEALGNVRELRRRLHALDEGVAVQDQLLALVEGHGVCDKQVHDANIVATMLAGGVDALLTLNVEDFRGFEGEIELVALPAG